MNGLLKFARPGLALLLAFSGLKPAMAQDWQTNIQDETNFFSIQQAFRQYMLEKQQHELEKKESEKEGAEEEEEDGPDQQYLRWMQFIGPRVMATGAPLNPMSLYREFQNLDPNNKRYKDQRGTTGKWTYSLPSYTATNSGGDGRINCLRFQPGNANVMYAGTPGGGLWKSADGGKSWNSLTDQLPWLSVTDVAISSKNTDEIYMATGDGYGYAINNGTFWGGTYSYGVMKSTDGGKTWKTTGLNYELKDVRQIYRLVIHPDDPSILVATTNNGIWRTTDGGATWTRSAIYSARDLKIHPKRSNEMYAGAGSIYRSLDTGRTWSALSLKPSSLANAILIGLTPADDSLIYGLAITRPSSTYKPLLYRSQDNGTTWEAMGEVPGIGIQGYFSSALGVSPVNGNEVYAGGVTTARSLDGGKTWSKITYNYGLPNTNYVHADHRLVVFKPGGSADTIFIVHDGGISQSVNNGLTWNQISGDIHALQVYRLGSSATDPDKFYIGLQDNGVNQRTEAKWAHVKIGDGMECQVDWSNPNVAYVSIQNGAWYKTDNGGASWRTLGMPSAGNWTSPFAISGHDNEKVYYGGNKLYMSENGGLAWKNISAGATGPNVNCIAVSHFNDSVIYISQATEQAFGAIRIQRTRDGGQTWKNVSAGLPLGGNFVSGISVDKFNDKIIYVALANFNAQNKVFRSEDGGDTWTNISAGLPNVPVNCVTIENSTENGVYVGTDLGVYYRSDNTTGWVESNDGLPLTIVNEIEVLPLVNKVRIATFGRGVWEADLAGTLTSVAKHEAWESAVQVYPNPAAGQLNIQMPVTGQNNVTVSVTDITGRTVIHPVQVRHGQDRVSLDISSLPEGAYLVQINSNESRITRKIIKSGAEL